MNKWLYRAKDIAQFFMLAAFGLYLMSSPDYIQGFFVDVLTRIDVDFHKAWRVAIVLLGAFCFLVAVVAGWEYYKNYKTSKKLPVYERNHPI
jgi:Na+/proline symporter